MGQTDVANLKLIEMENRAFALIGDGRQREAREILFSDEYKTQKKIYADGMRFFDAELKSFQETQLEDAHDTWLIGLVILTLAISIAAWLATIRSLFRSRENLLFSVAEKERTAENLRKSEQYQNLFKHANDAILIVEPKSEIVLNVNDKACEMYGFGRDEFVGRSLKTVSENVVRGEEQLQKLLEIGTNQEFETVQFRADGTPLMLSINAAVIEYEWQAAVLFLISTALRWSTIH